MSAVLNRRAAGATFPPPPALLLDTYPGAIVAYSSSRKLRAAYSGAAYRVRRASDNAEQDIAFLGTGQIDTAALATFCSGTTGRVVLWYDQSGNGVDAQQPTLSKAPIVYQSGAATLINSTPALLFTGAEGMNTANNLPWPAAQGQMTAVVAFRLTGPSIGMILETGYPQQHNQVAGGILLDVSDRNSGGVLLGGSGGNSTTSYGYAPPAAQPYDQVCKAVWNPAGTTVATENPTFQINNVAVTPISAGSPNASTAVTQFSVSRMAVGARGDAASLRLVGSLGELVLYPGDTHAAANALDLNVMGQYGIS